MEDVKADIVCTCGKSGISVAKCRVHGIGTDVGHSDKVCTCDGTRKEQEACQIHGIGKVPNCACGGKLEWWFKAHEWVCMECGTRRNLTPANAIFGRDLAGNAIPRTDNKESELIRQQIPGYGELERAKKYRFKTEREVNATPPVLTLAEIQRRSGSFRRMMEDYWNGAMSVEEELVIEDKFPRETILQYRETGR